MRAITVSLGKPYFLYLHQMYDCLREHPFFFSALILSAKKNGFSRLVKLEPKKRLSAPAL